MMRRTSCLYRNLTSITHLFPPFGSSLRPSGITPKSVNYFELAASSVMLRPGDPTCDAGTEHCAFVQVGDEEAEHAFAGDPPPGRRQPHAARAPAAHQQL